MQIIAIDCFVLQFFHYLCGPNLTNHIREICEYINMLTLTKEEIPRVNRDLMPL